MEDNGLIHAFILDGQGGGRPLTWQEVEGWTPAYGRLWVHLAYDARGAGHRSQSAFLFPETPLALSA